MLDIEIQEKEWNAYYYYITHKKGFGNYHVKLSIE